MEEKEVNLLEELNSISKIHFLKNDDIDTIMIDFAKRILSCLKIERMNVWLFNQDQSALISIGEYDVRNKQFSKNSILLKRDHPIYFNALASNEIIIAEEISNHALTKEFGDKYAKENDICTLLDIPLRISGELVGVMCYEKTGTKKEFTKDEISFCLSVSFVMASNLESRKRRAAQDKLEKLLHEKEILLKEINHRVKNNFSILISLLRLRKNKVKSEESLALIQEYEQRIFSMLKIHDMLEKSNQFSQINLSDYIKELIIEFRVTYPQINHNFKVNVNYLGFLISSKKAIHLGLIISEILLNSIKYASGKTKDYEVKISLQEKADGKIELEIGDNGSGFDFKGLSIMHTLGLELIKDLADSLDMRSQFPVKNNCYYIFNFKA